MSYSDFQEQIVSEKYVLARLSASRRYVGWENVTGNIYKFTNIGNIYVDKVEQNGNRLSVYWQAEDLPQGYYYWDVENRDLYVYLYDYIELNPNKCHVVVTGLFGFSNIPVSLPVYLTGGRTIFWEPLIKSTSKFGNAIDTINQMGESIDGKGNLQLINDRDFWASNFDQWSFDNKDCFIFSWNPGLELTDVQVLFKGKIVDKKYSPTTITFDLRDQINEIRQTINIPLIADLNLRAGDNQNGYRQRMLFGRVRGHIAVNVDRVLDGYPIDGEVEGVVDAETQVFSLEFTNTSFKEQLSPGDSIIIQGVELTIDSVDSDTSLTFDDDLPFTRPFDPSPILVVPEYPKKYTNRVFSVCGHTVREPLTVCDEGSTIDRLVVESNRDIREGDMIYIGELGSGELVKVREVQGQKLILLQTSLALAPEASTPVLRPAVQNVHVNDIPLTYYRDYTFDAESGLLTINSDAENNAGKPKNLGFDVAFTEDSVDVTGGGFSSLTGGMYIGCVGHTEFYEIDYVIDDTNLVLKTAAEFTDTAAGKYKDFLIDDESIVSCDVLGRTMDDETDGTLCVSAPQISKKLLLLSPIESQLIDQTSFDTAHEIVYPELSVVIPNAYDETDTPTYIDVINTLNKSVFGAITIKPSYPDSTIIYRPLEPFKKLGDTPRFTESDILNFQFGSVGKYIVRSVSLQYQNKEFDPKLQIPTFKTIQRVNKNAEYITQTFNERSILTCISEDKDAEIMASRWNFVLSDSMGSIEFTTKLQGSTLIVGDTIEVSHSKLFERLGGSGYRRLFLVESVQKNGYDTTIKAVDLSNALNKIACISEITNDYDSASESEKLYCGFYTDDDGLQPGKPETFNLNLIW